MNEEKLSKTIGRAIDKYIGSNGVNLDTLGAIHSVLAVNISTSIAKCLPADEDGCVDMDIGKAISDLFVSRFSKAENELYAEVLGGQEVENE